MTITLKTLTPLWTGGADGKSDRLHETGLIGSLRWWYEALVRGLGGRACDPSDHTCNFDEEKYRKSKATDERQRLRDAGICDACQVFGATGWARKFRLEAGELESFFDGENVLLPSGRIHRWTDKRSGKPKQRAGGWYVNGEGRFGETQLHFTFLRKMNLEELQLPLLLIARHASIGAKAPSGSGVIHASRDGAPISITPQVIEQLPLGNFKRGSSLPDLRDFFFAKLVVDVPNATSQTWWTRIGGIREAVAKSVTDNSQNPPARMQLPDVTRQLQAVVTKNVIPLAPAVRNWLRFEKFKSLGKNQSDYLFGKTSKNDNIASKINVSHAYSIGANEWEFRVWGWLPCSMSQAVKLDRDQFLDELKKTLESNNWSPVLGEAQLQPRVTSWHARKCNDQDGQGYLRELLEGGAS
ncbi:MAG: type III-B CRISPR module RAMP protein Cmr1 [Chloroflexi bacterium]|nr:type III-B CRISPR module RAMP protein Cmr1 [Chloroflexota bacterium]